MHLFEFVACSGVISLAAVSWAPSPEPSTIVSATARLASAQDEEIAVTISLRVPPECIGASSSRIIALKATAPDRECVYAKEDAELVEATGKSDVRFQPAHPGLKERIRADVLRDFTHVVGEEFGLERREYDLTHSTRPGSPIVLIEREPKTSLGRIWCYANSQDHWLCIIHLQPAPNIAVEARIRYGDRGRWKELVAKIEQFVSLHAQ